MISAILHPPKMHSHATEVSIKLVRQARRQALQIVSRARSNAARYLKRARRAGYSDGYQEGVTQARNEMQALLVNFRKELYQSTQRLHRGIEEGALALAAQIVGNELSTNPLAYRKWLTEALAMLQKEDRVFLHFYPAQEYIINELLGSMTPSDIGSRFQLVPDASLQPNTVFIRASFGRVGFGWQEALELAASEHSSATSERAA